MSLNWTSMWKVMTTWILESFHYRISSVSIYYAPELDIRVKSYDHLNFSSASVVQFGASRYINSPNQTSAWKVMTTWILESFRCRISRVSIYYARELVFRVKIYDHLNFSSASVVQLGASRYIMRLNRSSEWKIMTIWITRELSFFNLERLDILCALIGYPSVKLWPLEFLESFRCSISSVSIYYAP